MKACRTCLKVLYDETECFAVDTEEESGTSLPSLRSKLISCVPEMALDVIQSAVICCNCFQALNAAYNFKNTCLQTEERIINYTQCNGTSSIDIIDIVREDEGSDYLTIEDVKPMFNESSLLQPQVSLEEGSNYLHKSQNLPYSPEFDVEVKQYTPTQSIDPFGDINSPLLVYREIKPYKCTECPKCFVRKDKLMLHMRIHTGEKPFTCTFCGRSFSRKDKMNNHERIHTGEKPFQCIFCLKSFSRKDRMNAHMRSQHAQAVANLEITVVKKESDHEPPQLQEAA
ncbi:hypothetical protein PPYR_03530 [Photinus pyralis]|uniref:Protein krueppel n=1 Tax=Photinus pyralis TaxID=7054 RepID=A0A1Y1L587_PHOPY|nr:gastrula zinc finger protein xLCGF3.1-like [Photinus pyralis]KAB0791730.1 hypothetical protein PPYR_03530 [Photinus pyralis]